jgi:hypothetical protein
MDRPSSKGGMALAGEWVFVACVALAPAVAATDRARDLVGVGSPDDHGPGGPSYRSVRPFSGRRRFADYAAATRE